MDSGDTSRSQFFTLMNCMFNSDVELSQRVELDGFQPTGKIIRKDRATHRSDPLDPSEISDGHDAGNNRDLYSQFFTAFPEGKKIAVHKEQLRKDSICAGIDLSF